MEKDRERLNQVRASLKDRRIMVIGEISEESTNLVTRDLVSLGLESDNPIRLLMDSEGGDLTAAFKLSDTIRLIKAPVTCVVLGLCASAATIILLACERRMCTKHSRFLVHQARRSARLTLDDNFEGKLVEIAQDGKRMRSWIEDWYVERAKVNKETAKKLMHEGDVYDRYLSAQEAIELGFIHEIMESGSNLLRIENLS